MTDEDSWGDGELSGAEGLEFDDEFVLADPQFGEFKPPKADVYLSVLDMYRDRNRDTFIRNLPRLNFSTPVPEGCQRESPEEEQPKETSPEKKRLSVSQTYKDFLQYKRSIATSERLKEFKGIGRPIPPTDRGFHSFAGEQPKFGRTRQRAQSFAGEQLDKTVDISAALRPVKLFEDDPEVCPLDSGEKDEVEAKVSYLVNDQYFPGLIDDAVKKKIDFYQVSFDLTFGSDSETEYTPDKAPISLVEAFDLRVAKEQGARKKMMKEAPATHTAIPQQDLGGKSFVTFLKETAPGRLINRDEVVLANIVDVELATLVQNRPVNDLTKAINCLQKAEIMNEYDKNLQAAEEAYSRAPPELAETAAVQKATTFVAEELSKKTTTVGGGRSYRPIEIVSYMGITKPFVRESLNESRLHESRLADASRIAAEEEEQAFIKKPEKPATKLGVRPGTKPGTKTMKSGIKPPTKHGQKPSMGPPTRPAPASRLPSKPRIGAAARPGARK